MNSRDTGIIQLSCSPLLALLSKLFAYAIILWIMKYLEDIEAGYGSIDSSLAYIRKIKAYCSSWSIMMVVEDLAKKFDDVNCEA